MDAELFDRIKGFRARGLLFTSKEEDQLIAEVERLRAGNEWQPIETAPRDGTPVLAYGHGSMMVVIYRTLNECSGWSIDYGNYRTPTHWMPLPERPKQEED